VYVDSPRGFCLGISNMFNQFLFPRSPTFQIGGFFFYLYLSYAKIISMQ
jgi:hypothetical protein